PPAQNLLHALDFMFATDERVEQVFHRRLGQVAAELGQQRRFLDASQRRFFIQELYDVLANGVQPHPLFHQDGRRDRTFLAQDGEQQVLGPDVVVQQAIGLFGRKLQHPFGFGAERDFDRSRNLLAEDGAAFDFLANVLQREMGPGENAARQALPLSNQAEKQVLGFDRDAAELARLVASEEEDPSGPFRVPFEHPGYLSENNGVGVTNAMATL